MMNQGEEHDDISEMYTRFFDEDGQARSDEPIPIAKLVQLFRSPDPRVRSKVARVVGRYSQYQSFIARRLQEDDPRVRANAIESLWGVDTPVARRFLESSVGDSHHRARINALVGLYMVGNTASVRLLLKQTQHVSPLFRAAAVWAMGQTADPRFCGVVKRMASDENEAVRRVSALSAARIEQKMATLRQGRQFRARILRASGPQPEWRHASVLLPRDISESVKPTSFIVEENGHTVFAFEVERSTGRLPTRLGIVIPEHKPNSPWVGAAEAALTASIGTGARKDSFAIVRYKPGERDPGYSAQALRAFYTSKPDTIAQQIAVQTGAADLQDALNELAASLSGPDADRAVLMLAELDETGSNAAPFCPGPDVIAGLRSRNVPLHAIATTDGEGNPIRAACGATGGIFLQAGSAEELKEAFATLFSSFADRFEIRYLSDEQFTPGSSVKITIYGPGSWGEDTQTLV